MFCTKCGKEIPDGSNFCPNCASSISSTNQATFAGEQNMRCLPAFILGLIGSIFGILGGICTTMCSIGSSSNGVFIMIVGGSALGLIGACQCLAKAKLGSILEAAGALMIIYQAFFVSGADFMTVIGLVFLLLGAAIGIVSSFVLNRK